MFEFFKEMQAGAVLTLKIEELHEVEEPIFSLYEGQRMFELVESIKSVGVLTPIIVRELDDDYEILSGRNRVIAGKMAGLSYIPAYNLGKVDDQQAVYIMTESNIIQRGFMELKISERARCITERTKAMKYKKYREEFMEKVEFVLRISKDRIQPIDEVEDKDIYDLGERSIRRYVRINSLQDSIKEVVDQGRIPLTAAVNVSFLEDKNQEILAGILKDNGICVSINQSLKLRELEKESDFTKENVEAIIIKEAREGTTSYKLSSQVMDTYFKGLEKEEITSIIEKALALWFQDERK